jgi:hypothetical protein
LAGFGNVQDFLELRQKRDCERERVPIFPFALGERYLAISNVLAAKTHYIRSPLPSVQQKSQS